mmetsp:Transcript_2149/g.3961  ORF Transcript_2149/g.3961 Transcript_2149/m.3961 type:complete len:382 (-) Transcript_2149:154-1299(-)|eukprot:CAMPEP_0183715624 /NCGR_PEP_ID=MMETSP0737-20130205/9770_1 /TAXON_ID=385413 /ORGANISM="Thalassiosira miniscula, Strain CCMP1093" /LENGTH=381 /DNA_ID=CAMNT_0025944735 /DNA_START=35 /DNA_END=1180 /DNA_ORIENTATION=+
MAEQQGVTSIVIGAGPSGLASALGLSKVCKKVFLVEKHASFEKRGATFGMGKNGQLAWEELSPELMEYMRQVGMKPPWGETLVFVWWEMRDALLKFVKERDNIELYCGEKFVEIEDRENDAKVTFKSGLELSADFIVGADGVHSKVRNVLGLAPPIISDTTLFRGSLQVPESASAELKACLGGGMVPLSVDEKGKIYFILFNFNERYTGRLAWVLSTLIEIENNENITPFTLVDDHVTDEKKKFLITEVLSLSDEEHLKPYPKTSIIDLSDDALELCEDGRWGGRGRITLIGDAAHGMRPTDGYGGSMAMEDAVILSRTFKNCAEQNFSVQDLLRKYELERLSRVKRVYDNQIERYNTRMQKGERPGPQSKEFMAWLLAGV